MGAGLQDTPPTPVLPTLDCHGSSDRKGGCKRWGFGLGCSWDWGERLSILGAELAGLEASVDFWYLHDWVVIDDGKTGLVRAGILGHQRTSSDTWKGRGLWTGGPGLIYLETIVAGYTDLEPEEWTRRAGWVRLLEVFTKSGWSENQGGWSGATATSTSGPGGKIGSLAKECVLDGSVLSLSLQILAG